MTRYKYIHFVEIAKRPKTSLFSCRNNKSGAELGRVCWYRPWRQYCFSAWGNEVYSSGCLRDIAQFLDFLMADRRSLKSAESASTPPSAESAKSAKSASNSSPAES